MAAAVATGVAVVLCGCTTTQTTAARLQLNDARLRASADPVRVGAGETSTVVSVAHSVILLQGASVVTAVTLENHSSRTISDLPISVGYRLGKRTVYLNGAADLDYFDNHIPSISGHGRLTWVDVGGARPPRLARTFIRVGARPSVSLGAISAPAIRVRATVVPAARSRGRGVSTARPSLRISLTDTSSIPQYQLPVYGELTRRGRIVAAFAESISDLAGGSTTQVHVSPPLLSAGADSLLVQAPATIFR